VLKMLSIAVVQTKVISCNSANKSCLLQVVHTKAIAALTQFCDFLYFRWTFNNKCSKYPNQCKSIPSLLKGNYTQNEKKSTSSLHTGELREEISAGSLQQILSSLSVSKFYPQIIELLSSTIKLFSSLY